MIDTDRPDIFRHIEQKFGEPYTARVAAYGTIQSLAFIDDCGGGLATRWEWQHHPEKFNDSRHMKNNADISHDNPYNPDRISAVKELFRKDEAAAKEKYPEIFYYYDGMVGTRVSQSIHPAGIVISPLILDEEYGVFHKDGERCLLLGMEELHEVGAAKFDFLILKTVTVIRDCYALMGKKPPRMHEINWDDQKVWASMAKDANSIFQFESDFAAESMKRFRPKSILEMSLLTAALRPAAGSFRDQLLARIPHHNPSPLIDELLKNNLGYLAFQEDTIRFLQEICGLSGSESDNIRRAIGRKQRDRLEKALPKILEGYCSKSDRPREVAEKEAREFLQILEDSASYQFNYSHACEYCLLSYMCGYLRYYHPLEWIAAFMKNAANDDDLKTGKQMARDRGIVFTRPIFGQDNRTYYIDHEKKSISDAISSIKGVGLKDAEAILKIYNQQHWDCFTDVMYAMLLSDGALNKAVIEILIMSDYFRQFGSRGKLMHIATEVFGGKHRLTKTLKPATVYDRLGWLRMEEQLTPESDFSPKELIAFEIAHYGEPQTVDPAAKGKYVVLAVNLKYSPKIELYNISKGTRGLMKARKKYFEKNPVAVGDLLTIVRWHPDQAYSFSDGKRVVKPGVKDLWLDEYRVE